MLVMCGYNFCEDGDCLNPSLTQVNNIADVKLENGIFDHFNMTRDVTSPYSPDIPTIWDFLTLMNCNFDGNINAGNVGFEIAKLSGFKVKRRKLTDYNWITLTYIPITDTTQLQFVFNDNLGSSLSEYEYAFVPVVEGVEGNYLTNTITTKFDGVFVSDLETSYRFYARVGYGTTTQVQKVGVLEPFGRKYPVVTANAKTNYRTSMVSGLVLNSNYGKTGIINRLEIVEETKRLMAFLTNNKPKILKDWNGNHTLIRVVDTPTIDYAENFGMGIANVNFSYVEIGDVNSQSDLYNSGIIHQEN